MREGLDIMASSYRAESVSIEISAWSCPDRTIVHQATTHLAQHVHFRCHLESLEMNCREGRLDVEGQLPSFYLKQVLQTILRDVPGVKQVNNRVSVVSSTGLSSTRLPS